MISYLCVSNRDINYFITVIVSNLNNNNFWVILFYKLPIANNLTALFHSFFYFSSPTLLFQFPYLISGYNTEEPKINFLKETISFKIRKIEKIFLNQIKLIQYDLKKKHQQSIEYHNKFEKIWNNKPTWTLLRI
jgi:hypothetical protein